MDEYRLRGYGHTTSEIESFNFYEKWYRLKILDAIEIQEDITQKHRLLYAVDYNKELMRQLDIKGKQYEDVLGITVERDEDVFWENVYAERERFLKFIGG